MSAVVYDTGVLIAADRNERTTWADHKVRLEDGVVPVLPSVAVAQASRSPQQVQLRRFLRGCDVAVLDEDGAHDAGVLLGRTGTSDICDAVVVALAATLNAEVVTGDRKDLRPLVTASGNVRGRKEERTSTPRGMAKTGRPKTRNQESSP